MQAVCMAEQRTKAGRPTQKTARTETNLQSVPGQARAVLPPPLARALAGNSGEVHSLVLGRTGSKGGLLKHSDAGGGSAAAIDMPAGVCGASGVCGRQAQAGMHHGLCSVLPRRAHRACHDSGRLRRPAGVPKRHIMCAQVLRSTLYTAGRDERGDATQETEGPCNRKEEHRQQRVCRCTPVGKCGTY